MPVHHTRWAQPGRSWCSGTRRPAVQVGLRLVQSAPRHGTCDMMVPCGNKRRSRFHDRCPTRRSRCLRGPDPGSSQYPGRRPDRDRRIAGADLDRAGRRRTPGVTGTTASPTSGERHPSCTARDSGSRRDPRRSAPWSIASSSRRSWASPARHAARTPPTCSSCEPADDGHDRHGRTDHGRAGRSDHEAGPARGDRESGRPLARCAEGSGRGVRAHSGSGPRGARCDVAVSVDPGPVRSEGPGRRDAGTMPDLGRRHGPGDVEPLDHRAAELRRAARPALSVSTPSAIDLDARGGRQILDELRGCAPGYFPGTARRRRSGRP